MWPYICQLVEKLLHEVLEPAVKASDPHLSTFCFSKIDIGDKVSGGWGGGQLDAHVHVANTCALVINSFHVRVKMERGGIGGTRLGRAGGTWP